MDFSKPIRALLPWAALLFSTAAAAADPAIVPADPLEFERVHWRLTVDSCAFNEQAVRVELRDGALAVRHQPLQCFAPGPPEVVDIQLGAFPSGDYRVDFFDGNSTTPSLSQRFQVGRPVQIAVFPPPPHPIADYSGLWGTASEQGWGLSLHQGGAYLLFGALYVFDAQNRPQWLTLQAGSWENSTRWSGKVVRTEGPAWLVPIYASGMTSYSVVGEATLDFQMDPGEEGQARLTYSIDGQSVSKTITRTRL